MNVQEYYACVKDLGLTPHVKDYEGHSIYVTRDGQFITVPDPSEMSEEQRDVAIELLRWKLGFDTH